MVSIGRLRDLGEWIDTQRFSPRGALEIKVSTRMNRRFRRDNLHRGQVCYAGQLALSKGGVPDFWRGFVSFQR